jgi:hypothetical protein
MASGYLRAPDEAAGLADAGDLLSGLGVVQDPARRRRRAGRVRR